MTTRRLYVMTTGLATPYSRRLLSCQGLSQPIATSALITSRVTGLVPAHQNRTKQNDLGNHPVHGNTQRIEGLLSSSRTRPCHGPLVLETTHCHPYGERLTYFAIYLMRRHGTAHSPNESQPKSSQVGLPCAETLPIVMGFFSMHLYGRRDVDKLQGELDPRIEKEDIPCIQANVMPPDDCPQSEEQGTRYHQTITSTKEDRIYYQIITPRKDLSTIK